MAKTTSLWDERAPLILLMTANPLGELFWNISSSNSRTETLCRNPKAKICRTVQRNIIACFCIVGLEVAYTQVRTIMFIQSHFINTKRFYVIIHLRTNTAIAAVETKINRQHIIRD